MLKKDIEKKSFQNVKEEACGFIYLENKKLKILEVKNSAEDKTSEFSISAKTYLYAKENHEIVGIYHSHPSGSEEPSEYDKKCAEITCLPFIIFSIKRRKFSVFCPELLEIKQSIVEQLRKELL